MLKVIKKRIVRKKVADGAASPPKDLTVRESSLKIFDIPLDLLEGDPLNPNEMSDSKFDELVEGIRNDGFDDPIEVIPHPRKEGMYLIAGGHHRLAGARKVGLTHVPAIIKESWDEDKQKLALVRRNILHGSMNNAKFTTLYNELAKKYDGKLLQTMLGFTEKKEFESVYEGISNSLPPKQRAALAKAKEKIKSVDDLGSILNTIFKEAGSDIEEGYIVFSFGGKQHHYVNIDDATNRKLVAMKKEAERTGVNFRDTLQSIISGAAGSVPAIARKPLRRVKK